MNIDKVIELIENCFKEKGIGQRYTSIENYRRGGMLQVYCNQPDFKIIIRRSDNQLECLTPLEDTPEFNNVYRFMSITMSTLFRLEREKRMETIHQIFE
jgi:hypothetical protein